jgi:hypothetical protein
MKTVEVTNSLSVLATSHMVSSRWTVEWAAAFAQNLMAFARSQPECAWLEGYWREKIPYRHTGEQPVVSMMACLFRRYGACGDASAALAAAASATRQPWELHVEMCDGGGYAHARTIVAGVARDPAAEASLASPDRRVVFRPPPIEVPTHGVLRGL